MTWSKVTSPGAQDLFASDGVNVYAVSRGASSYDATDETGVFPVWSCPIVEYGRECVSSDLTNIPSITSAAVDLAVDTAGVVGQPGEAYLFVADVDGTISRCPVANAGGVACTYHEYSGPREATAMVVANGYLWVALQHGGMLGNGLLWRCGIWTNDDCHVFDDPKGPDVISLEVGGCEPLRRIGHGRYENRGSLLRRRRHPVRGARREQEAGRVRLVLLHRARERVPACSCGWRPNRVGWGEARIGIPDLAGRFAKIRALCTRAGKVLTDLSVTGPHGVRFDRRVDVCTPNAADWSFGSLDAGRYAATLRVHQFVLRGSATVAGAAVTEIRVV